MIKEKFMDLEPKQLQLLKTIIQQSSAPEGWREVKLGDVVEEIVMGQSPKSETYNTTRDGMPFYQGVVDFGDIFVTPRIYCSAPKKVINAGTILLSVRAPVGRVNMTREQCSIGRGNCGLKTEKNNQRFLFYLLKASEAQFENTASGTVFSSVSSGDIKGIEILLPPLPEQKAIAEILSSLDDKIDLLYRQNTTLENIAQTLFRKWFVEDAGDDWEVGKLEDIIDVIESGSRPKGGIDPNLKVGIASIGAESINGIGNFDFSKTKYISEEYFQNMQKGKAKKYDVLIYKDGAYIGKKAMYGHEFPFSEYAINEHVFILRTNEKATQIFLYFLLEKKALRELNTSSVQPGINQQAIKSLAVTIPPQEKIEEFDSLAKPSIDKILKNCRQIRTLENLRNLLLPKLMSGKVRIF
ncbi:MAG: restriction endonuclease subunit S [Salinispira sp.]